MNLKIIIKIVISFLLISLSSCATEQTFVKAKDDIQKGDFSEGLGQLKKLVIDNPTNITYKSYYYKHREIIISKLLQNAENARMSDSWDEAEDAYGKVLEIDNENARARDGLKITMLSRMNEIKIQEAERLLNDNQLDAAKEKIRQVLNDQPTNIKAKKINALIEQKKQDGNGYHSRVISKFKRPISLDLKDANIKSVFQVLSKAAGLNFILDKEIKFDTKVSIFVKNTTIDDALNNIFSTSQLSKKILNENSVLVYPNSRKSEYEEILAKTFYLNNVDTKKAEELIKTVIKTKDIFVDEKLNILVMRDTPDAIRAAEKLINSYDIGDPEVLLEVEILEISDTRASELGLRWPSQVSAGIIGAGGAGQLRFDEARDVRSNMARLSFADPLLILNLRSTEGVSNLLANPHIRVKNHKKAKVHIGDRVPIITSTSTSTGFVSESVSYLDVGLKLEVEPSIMISDEVSIDVGLEVSNIVSEVKTATGSLSYRLGTRNATTTLRLKNGETQILAGLINSEERTSADRVPGLASLPIVGRLFSSKSRSKNNTEIVLLITPKIVRNIASSESVLSEFSLGTETGNSRASISGGVSTGLQTYSSQPVDTQPIADVNANIESELNTSPILPIPLDIPPPPPLPGTVSP